MSVQRLVDEELLQPQQVADVERLAEAEADADLLAHLGRDGQRQVRGRDRPATRSSSSEDDEADDQQRRDREEQPPERDRSNIAAPRCSVGQRAGRGRRVIGPGPGQVQVTSRGTSRPRSRARCPRGSCTTPPSVLDLAETRPRSTSGMNARLSLVDHVVELDRDLAALLDARRSCPARRRSASIVLDRRSARCCSPCHWVSGRGISSQTPVAQILLRVGAVEVVGVHLDVGDRTSGSVSGEPGSPPKKTAASMLRSSISTPISFHHCLISACAAWRTELVEVW